MSFYKNLFNIFLVLLLFAVGSSCVEAKTIKFAVASDIHYKSPQGEELADSAKALNGFVSRMNENKYDFVVFLGDNIDKSRKNELESFLNIIKPIKYPYYLVMGNKDVHKISGLDKKVYNSIVSKHNKFQKKAQNNYYFNVNKDVVAIVLDSVSSGMPTTHGVISAKTSKWLDDTLTRFSKKQVIIFQHVPYFVPYEKDSYEILDKQEYKAILSKHSNVFAVISGHYHVEYLKQDGIVTHYCVPALSESPYNYTEMTIEYNKKVFQQPKNFKIGTVLKPAI